MLDRVGVRAQEMAEAYRDAAALTHDRNLFDAFVELADARTVLAQSVEYELRRQHELPRDHDPDRAAIKKMLRHAKAHLSMEGELALLRERERDEDALARQIADALAQPDMAPDAIALLEAQRHRVMATQARLAKLRVERTARPQ